MDNFFEPIWYRFFGHKHHIIKTHLSPAPWYEVDDRILYGIMNLVKWFVENDMRIWSKKHRDAEFKRIDKEEDPVYRKSFRESLLKQLNEDDQIIEIYKWWKNYDKRQRKIKRSLDNWHNYISKFKEDPEDWFGKERKKTAQEKRKDKRLLDYAYRLKDKLHNEEQAMLKKAIDLREHMWS